LEGTGSGGLNWSKWRYSGVRVRFILLANGAAFDIFSDVGGKAGPPEFGGD